MPPSFLCIVALRGAVRERKNCRMNLRITPVLSAAVLALTFLPFGARAQILKRIDFGVVVKNDFISPVLSVNVRKKADLECTLPINYKVTPGYWVGQSGLHSFYGSVKYVNHATIGRMAFDFYPLVVFFNREYTLSSGISDQHSFGLGLGKTITAKGWSIRPEFELSLVREWFAPSSVGYIEYYYRAWPTVGITIKR